MRAHNPDYTNVCVQSSILVHVYMCKDDARMRAHDPYGAHVFVQSIQMMYACVREASLRVCVCAKLLVHWYSVFVFARICSHDGLENVILERCNMIVEIQEYKV